jgi:hypothetical protein
MKLTVGEDTVDAQFGPLLDEIYEPADDAAGSI